MRIDIGWRAISLLAVAVACVAPSYAGNIVANGGFETGDLTGWTQTGNTGFAGVVCPGLGGQVAEGNCAAFFGPVGSVGGISQNLTTQVGTTYLINFDFLPDGETPSSFSALFGGTTLISLPNPASSAYQLLGYSVTATSTTTALAFNFQDDPGFLYLDGVSVQVAPEPGTVALVSIGMAGLWFWRRRRA